MTNDFTLSGDGRKVDLHSRDIQDWRITFVDTGLHANIGERLLAVRKYVQDEEIFLANYADGLSDIPLNTVVDDFRKGTRLATFVSVRPSQSFHYVTADGDGRTARPCGKCLHQRRRRAYQQIGFPGDRRGCGAARRAACRVRR